MMHPSFPAAKLVSSSYVFSLLPVSQFHNLSSLTDSSTTTGSQFNWRFIHRIAVLPKKGSEKAMAIHSSTLAWKIEEPGRLQSMGSLGVVHD